MAHRGHSVEATALALSFDLLCRIDEVLNIDTEKVVLPGDHMLEGEEEVTILWSGDNQMKNGDKGITVGNEVLSEWMKTMVQWARKNGRSKIFEIKYTTVAKEFKKSLKELGLEEQGFVVHSVRHGGAVHCHVIDKWSIESIRHRGGWKTLTQIDTYLQVARFHQSAHKLPRTVTKLFRDDQQALKATLVLAQSSLFRDIGDKHTKEKLSHSKKKKKKKYKGHEKTDNGPPKKKRRRKKKTKLEKSKEEEETESQ